MAELLLELLSEEIPARMQARAAEDLKRLVCEGLKEAGLSFGKAEAYVTPRRLALVVDGLPLETQPGKLVQRGPRVDAPQQAIDGFLRSVARPSVEDDEIYRRETKKGKFYFFEATIAPQKTARELPSLLEGVLDNLRWPKSMRWKKGQTQTWVRPMHRILAIFDDEKLDLEYNLIHTPEVAFYPTKDDTIFAGNTTVGHRFLSPGEITVKNFADYKKKLKKAHVMLDAAERRDKILGDAEKLAKKQKLTIKPDQGLLNEVAGLTEWPVVLMGTIDEKFLDLPPEVLSTAMRRHQKYFSLLDHDGKLAPRFVMVANTEAPDKGKTIVAGNQRVLRARLADARFFWDQDKKVTLESRVPALEHVIFHAKLGSVEDKVTRMEALVADLAPHVPGADTALAERTTLLAKADLTTQMVGEFPELQGIMGRYYALEEGENPEVAQAIAEHYSPQGPNDDCPTAPLSIAVALADKIDTLVGFFAIGEKPTGSRDPYALRRAALGVIRLIVENNLRLPLRSVLGRSYQIFGDHFPQVSDLDLDAEWRDWETPDVDEVGEIESVWHDLYFFFADRLKVHLKEKGVRHDQIAAVFALDSEDDLVRLLARVDALKNFLKSDDGTNLLVAYRRAANIVRIESKKDGKEYRKVTRSLFEKDQEDDLWQNLKPVQDSLEISLKGEVFFESMAALAQLRRPVDAFFDTVTVNAEDERLRANRLALLRSIVVVMNQVADFSKIKGGER